MNEVVQPQPSPMTVQVAQAEGQDGKKFVVLVVAHPTGQSVFHFDADGAERVAVMLKDASTQARSGLVVPPPGLHLAK